MKKQFIALSVCFLVSAAVPFSSKAENEIQKLINDAIAKKEKTITLPPGKIRINPEKPDSDYHLYVEKCSDLKIQGDNTVLVFTNPMAGGIRFEDCRQVTLTGVTLDWDPIPYAQGRITSINTEGPWLEIKPDKGYLDDPAMFKKEGGAMIYDGKTRLLKRGVWDIFGSSLSRSGDGLLRITCGSSKFLAESGAEEGDLLVLRGTSGKMGIRLIDCADMTISKVTILSAPGMGLQEVEGDGNNKYQEFIVTKGPAPEGGAERLVSTSADALHSSGVRHGPLVENCTFEYQGDDGLAIHGAYMLAAGSSDSDKILFTSKHTMPYRAGDRIRIYDAIDFHLKAELKMRAFSQSSMPKDADPVEKLWKKYKISDPRKARYYEVTFDSPVKIEFGDLMISPDWIGSGFTVRKNVFRHNRAQGMRIKSTDGIIEDNLFEGSSACGIALGPELDYWLEGDFAGNITIRNNTIRDVGTGARTIKHDKAILVGAISVYSQVPEKVLSSFKGNRDLLIEGNRIDNCGGIGMLLTCVKDSVVKNNTIGNTRIMKILEGGKVFGIDPDASIYVDEAENIKFEGNKFSGKGIVSGGKVKNIDMLP